MILKDVMAVILRYPTEFGSLIWGQKYFIEYDVCQLAFLKLRLT